MAAKFVVKRSGDQFMFNLQAANGQVVLTSERYVEKSSVLRGIASVRQNAVDDACYELGPSATHFNLKAGNGQVVGSSQSYSTTQHAQEGIQAVKRAAAEAEMEDQTV